MIRATIRAYCAEFGTLRLCCECICATGLFCVMWWGLSL